MPHQPHQPHTQTMESANSVFPPRDAAKEALSKLIAVVTQLQDNIGEPETLRAIVNQGSTGHALATASALVARL